VNLLQKWKLIRFDFQVLVQYQPSLLLIVIIRKHQLPVLQKLCLENTIILSVALELDSVVGSALHLLQAVEVALPLFLGQGSGRVQAPVHGRVLLQHLHVLLQLLSPPLHSLDALGLACALFL